jgi:hypothetical protein
MDREINRLGPLGKVFNPAEFGDNIAPRDDAAARRRLLDLRAQIDRHAASKTGPGRGPGDCLFVSGDFATRAVNAPDARLSDQILKSGECAAIKLAGSSEHIFDPSRGFSL